MRTMLSCAVFALVMASAAFARAGDGCAVATSACGADADPCGAGCCGHGCGLFGGCCGLFGHHCCGSNIEGLDRHFNCGCRGSYNYPVPPQYTYHWPGMYKQNLMTDYTSPWRFPPLKPYVDEQPVQAAEVTPMPVLRPISATRVISAGSPRSGEIESVSSRLSRTGR